MNSATPFAVQHYALGSCVICTLHRLKCWLHPMTCFGCHRTKQEPPPRRLQESSPTRNPRWQLCSIRWEESRCCTSRSCRHRCRECCRYHLRKSAPRYWHLEQQQLGSLLVHDGVKKCCNGIWSHHSSWRCRYRCWQYCRHRREALRGHVRPTWR